VNEQDIVFKAVSDLEAALPAKYRVRTRGGDSPAGPPLCLLDWDSTRINENGANPFADYTRDQTGDADGRELHRYRIMTLDVEIRTYDESERDVLLSDVEDAFSPYEYDSSAFHQDTTEWEVGAATPRSNPVVEPDWYEGGVDIRFKYVKRTEQGADSLETIQRTVNADMDN
jgi:hypothetical protein